MFQIGDWVKITPTHDLKWSRWYNNLDIYTEFVGKIGFVNEIENDWDDPNIKLYAVTVAFPNGFMFSPSGNYYEYFKSDHLIRSSEYDAELQQRTFEAGKQLQEWEDFKRKSTDDMLRHIFGPEEKEEPQQKQAMFEEWEEKTEPIWKNIYND